MKNLKIFILLFLLIPLSKGNSFASSSKLDKFLQTAYSRVGVTKKYDSGYYKLKYPMGDVPNEVGVCSDVIVRSYRGIDIDLQVLVHKDMHKNLKSYPKELFETGLNSNVDHRRVPNLMVFFKKYGKELSITKNHKDYKPGDIVMWDLSYADKFARRYHIGIVSDKKSKDSDNYLILHHSEKSKKSGTQLEDILFKYEIIGHYRYSL